MMAAEAAPGPGAVRRWAAAHAATITRPAAGAARGPAVAPVPGFPREPVPVVLAAFTEVRTWDGGAEHINRVAWAPDPEGRLLLATAAMDGVARIWDAGTGRELHTLTGHTREIGKAEWGRARDGRLVLATGSFDGTARIWDSGTGECLHTLLSYRGGRGSTGGISVAWGADPDGSPVLATGAPDGIIRFWDPGTGQELPVFPSEESGSATGSGTYCIAWATGADGQARLAACSFSRGTLRIWDPGTGRALYTSSARPTRVTHSIAYGRRADGQLVLASADDDEVRVWAEENGELTSQSLPGVNGGTITVRWARLTDGRLLLATATDDAVHLWDGHALRRLHTAELDLTDTGSGRIDWTLAPDGRLLLATAANGGQVRIWEAVLDPPARPSGGEARHSPASAPAVPRKPGPARLVLPPREVTPRFPDAAQIRKPIIILACATTPDGQTLIATISESVNDAQLWDLESGRHLRTLTGHSGELRDVAWAQAPDGRLLLATGSRDRTARIWDPKTGQAIRTLTGHGDAIYAVAWGTQPDGTLLLATGSEDGTARIWDPETGQPIRTLTGHGDFVCAVAWGNQPDGTLLLATGGSDDTARIWDPETGQELRTLTGHSQAIDSLAWANLADGAPLLATGSRGGTARIWDPDTGQAMHTTRPDERGHEVDAVAWARAAGGLLLLATAGDGGTARIWDPGTGAELASLPGPRSIWRSAAWIRDGEGNLLLLLASPDPAAGPVRAWLVETGAVGRAEPQEPGRPGMRRAAEVSRQLLRLGAGGLWLPLGLLADLVALTGTEDTAAAADLHDARLGALADEPGIGRLAGLAAGQPPWRPDARAAFAALLAAGLGIPARYTPPPGAPPAELRDALAEALTAGAGPGVPAGTRQWRVAVADLRAAGSAVDDQMITLLAILGPDACAADPLLPLRLAHHVPRLPALSPRQLQFLASTGGRQPPSPRAAAAGTLTYSPGTAGVARTGPLTRLLPTQLALPADLLTARLAGDQLLYRQHRAPAPPAPEPVTLILDTTPPTYGPAGTVLRLAAHLITTTLWAYGRCPALITLDTPDTPAQLHAPADLITIWTATTLDNPAAPLAAARRTAAALGQPAVLLTHHQTARDSRYALGPGTRLLTTHQPPEKPPPEPASPWHAHLPPAPTQVQLTTAITRLLTPTTQNGT